MSFRLVLFSLFFGYSALAQNDLAACLKGKTDFDFLDQFPPPKNQGKNGVCWAFGGTAQVEHYLRRRFQRPVELSETAILADWVQRLDEGTIRERAELAKKLIGPTPEGLKAWRFLDGNEPAEIIKRWQKTDSPRMAGPDELKRLSALNVELSEYLRNNGAARLSPGLSEISRKYQNQPRADREVVEALHDLYIHSSAPFLGQQGENLGILFEYRKRKLEIEAFLAFVRRQYPKLAHDDFDSISKSRSGALADLWQSDPERVKIIEAFSQMSHREAFEVRNDVMSYVYLRALLSYRNLDYKKGQKAINELQARLEADCLNYRKDSLPELLNYLCRKIAVGFEGEVKGMEVKRGDKWEPFPGFGKHAMAFAGVRHFNNEPYFILRNSWKDEKGDGDVVRIPFKRICLIESYEAVIGPGEYGYPEKGAEKKEASH